MKVHFNNYFPEGVPTPTLTYKELRSGTIKDTTVLVREMAGAYYGTFDSREEANKFLVDIELSNQYKRAIFRERLK